MSLIMLMYLDGLPFLLGRFKQVVEDLMHSVLSNKTSKIIFPATLHELALSKDETMGSFYRQIDYCTSDSMLLTYFFRYKTGKKVDRVYGPELVLAVLNSCEKNNFSYRHLFLAPNKTTMHKLKILVKERHPQIQADYICLPKNINFKQEFNYLKKIDFTNFGFIWIGIGSPKQMQLASWLKVNYRGVVVLCVGAALDFLTGQKMQAPVWLGRMGFEWLFRLLTEPRRLWKRYLIVIPKYLFKKIFL